MYLVLIFLLLCLLSLLEINIDRKISSKLVFPIFLLFFTLSFIRWERGTDWESYLNIYQNINVEYYQKQYEFLFIKINQLPHLLYDNYTFTLFLQACVIFPLIYFIIKKYSPSPLVSILVWFSTFFGSIFFTRQFIAFSVVFLSFHYIVQRKFFKFFGIIVIATMFHQTAIIFLLAYFIYPYTFKKQQVVLIILGSFFLSTVIKSAFGFLGTIDYAIIAGRATDYLDNESTYSPMQNMLRGIPYRIFTLGVALYFYKLYEDNNVYKGLVNIYFLGIVLFIMLVPISNTLIRFAPYFEFFQILIYSFIVITVKERVPLNIFLLGLFIYLGIRLHGNVVAYEDLYIPFKTIFNKDLPVNIY